MCVCVSGASRERETERLLQEGENGAPPVALPLSLQESPPFLLSLLTAELELVEDRRLAGGVQSDL